MIDPLLVIAMLSIPVGLMVGALALAKLVLWIIGDPRHKGIQL